MGKTRCAVTNCSSGSSKDRKARKDSNESQVALFGVPKHIKTKWEEALKQHLDEDDRICEFHFEDDDIVRFDKYDHLDGTTTIIPRKRYSLKSTDVIPKERASKDSNGCTQESANTSQSHDLAGVLSHQNQSSSIGPNDASDKNTKQSESSKVQQINDGNPIPAQETELNSLTLPQLVTLDENTVRLDFDNNGSLRDSDIVAVTHSDSENICIDKQLLLMDDDTFNSIGTFSNIQASLISNPINSEHSVTMEVPNEVDSEHDVEKEQNDSNLNSASPCNDCLQNDDDYDEHSIIEAQDPIEYANHNSDENIFNVQSITNYLEHNPLPEAWSWINKNNLMMTEDQKITGRVQINNVQSMGDILRVLRKVEEEITFCDGTGFQEEKRSKTCQGFFDKERANRQRKFFDRCDSCKTARKNIYNRKAYAKQSEKEDPKDLLPDLKYDLTLLERQIERSQQRMEKLKQQLKDAEDRVMNAEKNAINDLLAKLPQVQQEVVNDYVKFSGIDPKQRRYSIYWIHTCILLRIKNKALYEHMREMNILPLPTRPTLSRYLQKIESSYGFQTSVFECLKLRGSRMEESFKHGVILADEMSLSEAVALCRKTMQFEGFVNLGEYTPKHLQNTRTDHVLVFMFQPFKGQWVQVIGAFTSSHAVTSNILQLLIIDATIKMSQAGYYVDGIIMDGAQWNRGVWTHFGISVNKFFCDHPYNESEKLWFFSDFPHLLKCFRNLITKFSEFWTPDGIVKLAHWQALLKYQNKHTLSVAYKLTQSHVTPKGYETMNCLLAYQLFDERVAVAMELYQNDERYPELRDCAPTIKFIKRVNNLIKAMTARAMEHKLSLENPNRSREAILDFDQYLTDWKNGADRNKFKFPLSASTYVGLKVTLGATIELLDYLVTKCFYEFLLTCKLTQDAIERFFGIMRRACGSNDHPDPILFIQVLRLLLSYSLVKVPRGSNVDSAEILEMLTHTKESVAQGKAKRDEWLAKIDSIIEGTYCSEEKQMTEHATESKISHLENHDYDVTVTDGYVLSFMAGYVVRKMDKFTKCQGCRNSLETSSLTDRHKFIQLMDHGELKYPSLQLEDLIETLEISFAKVVQTIDVTPETMFAILDEVSSVENVPLVGCEQHLQGMTRKIIDFYLVMRGSFLGNSTNRLFAYKKQKSKQARKNSKF